MNTVMIVGTAGRDPEVRYLESGKVVVKFSLASTVSKEETDWFGCEAWSKTAEIIGQYVKKGNKVAVSGKLDIQSYQKDGVDVIRPFILVERVELMPKGKSEVSEDEEF